MEPSSSSSRAVGDLEGGRGRRPGVPAIVHLDRAVLVALAAGLALYVMPFWAEGRLRAAFWLTLLATLLHIYTSHKCAGAARIAEPADPAQLEGHPTTATDVPRSQLRGGGSLP